MKLRELLIATAMLLSTFVSANAFKVNAPSPLIEEDQIARSAYDDTVNILNSNNECSEFFGGPAKSVDVFNELMGKARKGFFSSSVGITMSGKTTSVENVRTRSKYRLFDKVSINANGPFYRNAFSKMQPSVPGVGSFQPNTREVRVLMLLHELGHVVEADGKWLLPDDGRDAELSRKNTRKIEDVCGDEIRNLGKGDTVAGSVSGKELDEKSTAVRSTP